MNLKKIWFINLAVSLLGIGEERRPRAQAYKNESRTEKNTSWNCFLSLQYFYVLHIQQ